MGLKRMLSTFWVTTDCNMECKYCYEGSKKDKQKMSLETIEAAINYTINHFNELNNDNTLVVVMHGGEPLLEFEKIKSIISGFRDRLDTSVLKFAITTNGTLISDEIKRYLCKEFYSISLSIDGNKTSHDANRIFKNGSGTYDSIFNSFCSILEKRPDTRARMTVNTDTVLNLYENVKHLVDLGFKTVIPVPDTFDNRWNVELMDALYKQLEKVSVLLKERKKTEEDILIGLVDEITHKRENSICNGGVSSINIDPKGNIYPCTYTVGNESFIIGHVSNGILKEKLDEIIKLGEVANKDCEGCTRYNYCVGTRCKLINKLCTDNYHTPSPVLCSLENIKVRIYKYYEELS